jgi:hypothetical protein
MRFDRDSRQRRIFTAIGQSHGRLFEGFPPALRPEEHAPPRSPPFIRKEFHFSRMFDGVLRGRSASALS